MEPAPALKPPPGQVADFTDPPTAMVYVIVCFAICLPVTSIAFALRTWTRIAIKWTWTVEDWMCTFGWTTFVVFFAFVTTLMHSHGGIHEWDLYANDVHQALFWSNAAMIAYAFCMLTVKLAILLLYQRVFVTRRWTSLDWVIKIMLVVIILFYVSTTFVKIFSCTPRAKIWDSTVPGSCINIARVLVANGIFNVVTDSLILLIPTRSVWNLQMSTKKKIGVVAIFSVGSMYDCWLSNWRVPLDTDITPVHLFSASSAWSCVSNTATVPIRHGIRSLCICGRKYIHIVRPSLFGWRSLVFI